LRVKYVETVLKEIPGDGCSISLPPGMVTGDGKVNMIESDQERKKENVEYRFPDN
jgi:hypothetical protein